MSVFDIPAARLADLSDGEFRELVARLCETEIERQGGNRLDVRWGGEQGANDGGLDVVVEARGDYFSTPNHILPCRHTGLQVKKGMPGPKEAANEMLEDNGLLRQSISTLAENKGAYLIVSARENCTQSMRLDRLKAMRKVVEVNPVTAEMDLGFVGSNEVARWVSKHPSVAAWLRERLSLPCLDGWKPYGRWSGTPMDVDDSLIIKKGLLFKFNDKIVTDLVDAIDEIRGLVKTGDAAVRIVGHSGIGKTRIVQSLFEEGGNTQELARSRAVYADVGQTLTTSPSQMLDALILLDTPEILVVDNCPPDTHRILARRLGQTDRKVRLMTVEYDVQEDLPEQTDVVTIKAEGSDIVERLLRRRRPDLSHMDARRLAELAQGNARLGLALANFAPRSGSLAAFEDTELFERLFWQRNEFDQEFKTGAEVLSLVYSFDVEGEEDPDELYVLGTLIDQSTPKLVRYAKTLVKRGLAKERDGECAILPQALANRLAQDALVSIRWRNVARTFADKSRLRESFARRLSYLPANVDAAREIILDWMNPRGPLEDPTAAMKLVRLVSHLVKKELLDFVEKRINTGGQLNQRLGQIDDLISITELTAHDVKLYSRACHTLIDLALRPNRMRELTGKDRANKVIENLFTMRSSGTSARPGVPVSVARKALNSREQREVDLGIRMLSTALETDRVRVRDEKDAQPYTFGRELQNEEIVDWLFDWIRLAADVVNSGNHAAERDARMALENGLIGIWRSVAPLRNLLIETIREINARKPWPEARKKLIKLLQVVQRWGDDSPDEDINAVECLIRAMSYSDLAVRVYSELVGDMSDDRRVERLEHLGYELAADLDVLRIVMPEILRGKDYRLRPLGEGIASVTVDPITTWDLLKDAYLNVPESKRNISVLSAYVRHLNKVHPKVAEFIRKECRDNDHLRCDYGFFLPEAVLSREEIDHVIKYAADPIVNADQLVDIAWRKGYGLSDIARIKLMRSLLSRSEGPKLVVKALQNLCQYDKTGKRQAWSANLRKVGLEALERLISSNGVDGALDLSMGIIARYCLREDDDSGAARLLTALSGYAARHNDSVRHFKYTASAIAAFAPVAYLNAAAPDPVSGLRGFGLRDARFGFWTLSGIPPIVLVNWCLENDTRWMRIVPYLELYTLDQSGDAEHTNKMKLSCQIVAILEFAPEPDLVVDVLIDYITERGVYSGSLATIIERRLEIFDQLKDHPRREVGNTISTREADIRKRITAERKREAAEEAVRNQRFE